MLHQQDLVSHVRGKVYVLDAVGWNLCLIGFLFSPGQGDLRKPPVLQFANSSYTYIAANIGQKRVLLNRGNPFPKYKEGEDKFISGLNCLEAVMRTIDATQNQSESSGWASNAAIQSLSLGKALLTLQNHPPLFIQSAKFKMFLGKYVNSKLE